jgi:serpin B
MLRYLFSIVALAATLAAQTKKGVEKTMEDTQALERRAKTAAQAQNSFGLKMAADLAADHPHKNVFISPLSVYLALAMAETGSAGGTRNAMRRAMAVPETLGDDAFHESAAALSRVLRTRREVELSIANALWSDPSFPLAPAYVKRCAELFEAEATALEFRKPGAADIINHWVKQKTKDKIQEIVSQQQVEASKAILTNAVYFKGGWLDKFSKEATHDGPFHLAGGGVKQVPLMHQTGLRHAYFSGDGFEAASLQYGHSGVRLYAILPAPGRSPEQALAAISVEQLTRGYNPAELELKLPRFTLDYSASLKSELSRMGMSIAFKYPGAEFAPLGSPLFYLGEVLHKTRLEIDEEGTVAAAVTAIIAPVGAAMPQRVEKKVLIFDRPFALLLVDDSTGAILFAGVVYEP